MSYYLFSQFFFEGDRVGVYFLVLRLEKGLLQLVVIKYVLFKIEDILRLGGKRFCWCQYVLGSGRSFSNLFLKGRELEFWKFVKIG